ncbi:hypothetical protein EVA_05845 [gut metagenome]|uniref:Uncharacterized protein n=1 Tax=gut metagenome TaxID=749906 RepID=J9GFC4_9ZZZZ
MPHIKEMVVQSIESSLVFVGKCLVGQSVASPNSRMETMDVLAITNEEHLRHHIQERITTRPLRNCCTERTLRCIFRTELPNAGRHLLEIQANACTSRFLLQLLQIRGIDKSPGIALHIGSKAKGVQFLDAIGKSWIEATQNAINLLRRNFPDTEETQDMIDSVGIEVLTHVCQASPPPLVAILTHLFPIIGRETPVLTIDRKGIGRSARLAIEVEEFTIDPCRNTISVDANRNITLQDDPHLTCILMDGRHLTVEEILHQTIEISLFFQDIAHLVCRNCPILEVGTLIEVTQHGETRIIVQPVLVLVNILLVTRMLHHLIPIFLIESTQKRHLSLNHLGIV